MIHYIGDKISKELLTLQQQRNQFEIKWEEVFRECLDGNVDQSKLLSAMYSLNQIDFEILEDESRRKKVVEEEYQVILNKKRKETIEFHKKRGFDIEAYYQSLGIEF
jgi:hypothetical protein